MKLRRPILYFILLGLCTLYSCGDIDSKPSNSQDALKRYTLWIISQYNKYADDTLSFEEQRPKQEITVKSRTNWAGLSSDIKYFVKRKKETLAWLDSIPEGKHKFTYKAIQSFLINAGFINKPKVINELGEPHDTFYLGGYPKRKYPERMLQIDSSLCVGIYSYEDPRSTSAMRYFAYGDINKKTNEPDLYIFDFIIGQEDRLIGIRTSKFIITTRSFYYKDEYGYIE